MQNIGIELKKYLQSNQIKNQSAKNAIEDAFFNAEVQVFLKEHQDELANDFFDKSAAKVFEFVKQKKLIKAGKPSIAPGYVPELLIEKGYVEVSYRPTKKAILADKQKKRKARIKAINMPKSIKNASFEDLELDSARQNVIGTLIDWVADYLKSPNSYHQGLYIYGSYGVGKTYLMGALANELADHGIEVTMFHFPTLAVEMRNSISNKDANSFEKINAIKESTVLIVDDIGAESISPWIRDDVLGVILEYRMQNELSTFFTSNFDMKQLQNEHLTETRQAKEPVKAERLMQRIKFLSKEILMGGFNRRPGV